MAVEIKTAATQGLTLEPHQIILRPLVTEKGMHRSTRYNAYAFEIHRQATKIDVRRAVEELFNVKVVAVHTQNRKGKPRRTRFSPPDPPAARPAESPRSNCPRRPHPGARCRTPCRDRPTCARSAARASR